MFNKIAIKHFYLSEEFMDRWDKRFMDMAELVSTWTSCARKGRAIGAVIVKDKRILTTGYNGAPSGIFNCRDKGYCMRDELGIKSGTQQEKCYAVHAEQNAIAQAAKKGISVDGATLYCTHQPCTICTRIIINSGIARVVYKHPYPDEFSMELFNEAGIPVEQFVEE